MPARRRSTACSIAATGPTSCPAGRSFRAAFATKTSLPTSTSPSGSGSTRSISHPSKHPSGTSSISTSCSGARTSRTRSSACWEPSARESRPSSTITCRCYCGTKGRNRAEFDKKLIVHFDSKVIQDNTDFYHDFFLFAQSSIRYQCSQKGFEIDLAIKRRPTQPNNVREWVWAALEELTRIAEKRDPAAPFHHIVLVVDNLDQTPPAVQIRAITEVEQWLLTPSIKLCAGVPAALAEHV